MSVLDQSSVRVGMREAIAVLAPEASVTSSVENALQTILAKYGAKLRPLFAIEKETGDKEDQLRVKREMSTYRKIVADDRDIDEIVDSLRGRDEVQSVYYAPAGGIPRLKEPLLAAAAAQTRAAVPTDDFTKRQVYLERSTKGGVDAKAAWTVPGGDGDSDVRIVDLEFSWDLAHEDKPARLEGVLLGTPSHDETHGTMVLGVLAGNRNGFGVTGICPRARIGLAAFDASGLDLASTITAAAERSNAGDIMLIELERLGGRPETMIPIEWWRETWLAIRAAVIKGIVVVAAGGNSNENLDDSFYDHPLPGFPPSWSNPFRRTTADSGAILVGAGAPPAGTHGVSTDPDRSRTVNSNFGSAIDVQGWGEEVTTTGRGDLFNPDPHRRYTDGFSSTSAATAMIAGVLACVQSARQRAGRPLLTSTAARDMLRGSGLAQQNAPGRLATQNIGRRPDLRELHARGFF